MNSTTGPVTVTIDFDPHVPSHSIEQLLAQIDDVSTIQEDGFAYFSFTEQEILMVQDMMEELRSLRRFLHYGMPITEDDARERYAATKILSFFERNRTNDEL